jgi:uncharacterized OB-fold protein
MSGRSDLGAPFWQGLKERKLMLQFDAASGRAQFYPRPQSLYGEAGVEWREASGRGVILALTLSHVSPPALAGQLPYTLALVRLDEGPRMLVRIAAPRASLSIGQAVKVAWEAREGREEASGESHAAGGAVFPVFEPA